MDREPKDPRGRRDCGRAIAVLAVNAALAGCGRVDPLDPAWLPPRTQRRVAQLAREHGGQSVAFPLHPTGCGYSAGPPAWRHAAAFSHAEHLGSHPAVRNLHLTFVGDPSSSVVVQWSTDDETLASEVRIGTSPDRLDRVVHGYSFAYANAPTRRQHEVHVCGLSPATTYFYDAGGAGRRSRAFRFVTAPDGPREVRVLVAGDSRSFPHVWGRVAARAREEAADVLLFTGDVVSSGEWQSQWDAFFGAAEELLATTPGYWADGNHEGGSEVFLAQFALPGNGTPHGHEHWYSAAYGPLRVIVLNDTTVPPAEVTGHQVAFLRDALAAVDRARTPFVVTMHHRPMYTTSAAHPPDLLTREAWGPLIERAHVNADLASHVHSYESTFALREGAVTDEAHGTVRLTFGGAGAELYGFREAAPFVRHRESTHGYGVMTVSPTQLRWVAHRIDGSVMDTVELGP